MSIEAFNRLFNEEKQQIFEAEERKKHIDKEYNLGLESGLAFAASLSLNDLLTAVDEAAENLSSHIDGYGISTKIFIEVIEEYKKWHKKANTDYRCSDVVENYDYLIGFYKSIVKFKKDYDEFKKTMSNTVPDVNEDALIYKKSDTNS